MRVLHELAHALSQRGFDRLQDAVGLAHRPPEMYVPEDPDPVGDDEPLPTRSPVGFEEDH
jgi:hypothetical protein